MKKILSRTMLILTVFTVLLIVFFGRGKESPSDLEEDMEEITRAYTGTHRHVIRNTGLC